MWTVVIFGSGPIPVRFNDNPEYEYLDIWGFGHDGKESIVHRYFVSLGARTDAANLPAGIATYVGRMRADTFSQRDPSINSRVRVFGDLNLTANFDGGTLEGTVSKIYTRGQNETNWFGPCPIPPSSRSRMDRSQTASSQLL